MFKSPWWVVFGSTLGLTVGNAPVMFFTFGVFLGPITNDLGLDRATVSSGPLIGLALAAIISPFVGKLIDRYGVRRVTLTFITLFSSTIALISLAPASAAGFLFLYSLCLLFSGGQSAIPYAKAVSAWFDQKRGLALGIAMSGTGIGVFVMPLFATILIDAYGWRSAFVGLAITTFAVGFPAVALFVRDPPAAASDRVKRAPATPGIPAAAAWRSGRFWLIAIAAFLVVMAVNGTNGHLVPLLMDRGLSARVAASAVAVMGLSTIAGRLIGGYLMDRIFAPYLAAGVFLLPLVPLTLLGAGAAGAGPFVAAICLGLSLGAEVDLLGFLVSRYFGLSAFGEIYGYVFAIFTFGAGIGVYFMGLSFDLARSYNPALVGFGACLVVAGVLISRLGPYVYPAHRPVPDAVSATTT